MTKEESEVNIDVDSRSRSRSYKKIQIENKVFDNSRPLISSKNKGNSPHFGGILEANLTF